MASAPELGVLLPQSALSRIVSGRPTWERAVHYVTAARRFGTEVIIFSISGYDAARDKIRGYVRRNGRWSPWRGDVPLVVHNRYVPMTLGAAYLVRWLERRLPRVVFNPVSPHDSWELWQPLLDDDQTGPYTPSMWPVTAENCAQLPAFVREQGAVALRARTPGASMFGLYIEAAPGRQRRLRVKSPKRPMGPPQAVSEAGLIRLVERKLRWRPYLVQAVVPALTYRQRSFAIRVPVQRDGVGRWQALAAAVVPRQIRVPGAGRHIAAPAERVLAELFGLEGAGELWKRLQGLALAVAEHLSTQYERLADLTVDIAIDPRGDMWLEDLNLRDDRLAWKRSGQLEVHEALYHNPIAYGHRLVAYSGR